MFMSRITDYLHYFSFFIRHYPPLAPLLLYDEIRGEQKYRLNTTGFEKPDDLKRNGFAFSYMPSNYRLLERVFDELNRYDHNHTFLDIGCGKGRCMMVAAHFGFQKITGVEMINEYCRAARKQIIRMAASWPAASFEIICTDAWHYKISGDIQTIFFYNPFKETIMDGVIGNILNSLQAKPRTLFVVYLNPLFKQIFLDNGFTEIYSTTRFKHLKACILTIDNKPLAPSM
jgi:16S rRNA G966 N2-methylase RsmD